MSVVKINAITVPKERADELVGRFAARAGQVSGSPGFEAFELLQPSDDPNPAGPALYLNEGPAPSQVSYTTLLLLGLTIAGSPFLVWRWWRRDRGSAVTLTFLWLTVVYVLATTSLIEFGENNRYTMSLGPLPLIASVVVVTAVARALHRGRHRPPAVAPIPHPVGSPGHGPPAANTATARSRSHSPGGNHA